MSLSVHCERRAFPKNAIIATQSTDQPACTLHRFVLFHLDPTSTFGDQKTQGPDFYHGRLNPANAQAAQATEWTSSLYPVGTTLFPEEAPYHVPKEVGCDFAVFETASCSLGP